MGKSPDAFRTISEVADWLDTQPHVLRFWESKFTQVKPVKRAGGRRYYRPNDMLLLGGIKKLLHDDGMTIKGVQKILREQGIRSVSAMSPILDDAEDAAQPVDAAPFQMAAPASEDDRGTVLPFQSPEHPPAPQTPAQEQFNLGQETPEAATPVSADLVAPEDDTPVPHEDIPVPVAATTPGSETPEAEAPAPAASASTPEPVAEPTATDALTNTALPAFIRRSAPPADTSDEPAADTAPVAPVVSAPASPPDSAPTPQMAPAPQPQTPILKPRQISVPADPGDSDPAPQIGVISTALKKPAFSAIQAAEIGQLLDQLDAWRSGAAQRGA